jgi:uncharacterized protein (DUF1499 family)
MRHALLAAILLLAGCSTAHNDGQLVGDELRDATLAQKGLTPCPETHACVSSLAQDDHAIAPLTLGPDDDQTVLAKVKAAALAIDGSSVEYEGPGYLQIAYTSSVFRFVDDLELWIDRPHGALQVRSASRFGYYDWGANRRRVEALREALAQ